MQYNLESYTGKYNVKWVRENMTWNQQNDTGTIQIYIAGFNIGSINKKKFNNSVEKYIITKITEALKSEDNFGKLHELKKKWFGGKIKKEMDSEIKKGTYLIKTEWIYKTGKNDCCFVDKNDPNHKLNIDANQAEIIKKLREYGNPSSIIIEAMDLDISEAELDEFITENMDGNLDSAFNFICGICNDKGLVNHKNPKAECLYDKTLHDFKITIGE